MTTIALIYTLLQKYLVPFLFSIGLFYYVYGIIEYFVIGKGGDEGRAQHGREQFLKSIAWFVIAIMVYAVVALIGWLATFSFDTGPINPPGGSTGSSTIESRPSILPVPNIPTR